MNDAPRPLYGPKAFKLDIKDARAQGFRIFRAWRSCGCCKVDMAFRSLRSAKSQFTTKLFAAVVRDDIGNIYEAVNTGRGFVEIQLSGPKPKPHMPILPVLVRQPQAYQVHE